MEANRSQSRWTYAEYMRLPMSGSTRYEVIDGRVEVTPSPTSRHQRIVMRLGAALHGHASAHGLGEVFPGPIDVLFGEGDYVQPDLVFVRADRKEVVSLRGIEGPPDLIIEILSPSTADRDRGVKLERYRHHRVPEYWIVDPDARAVEVWRLGDGAAKPEVVTDVLEWAPVQGAPRLALRVEEVVGGG